MRMGIKVITLEAEDGIDIVENTRRHLKSVGLKEGRLADDSPAGAPDLYFFGKIGKEAKIHVLAYCLPAGAELSEDQQERIKRNQDKTIIIFREMVSNLEIEMMVRQMTFLKDRVQKLKVKAEELEKEVDELTILKEELRNTVR